jgi:hypothetical protein
VAREPGVVLYLREGHSVRADLPADDPEAALERMLNREGEFENGWVTARNGDVVNLEHVIRIQRSGF